MLRYFVDKLQPVLEDPTLSLYIYFNFPLKSKNGNARNKTFHENRAINFKI